MKRDKRSTTENKIPTVYKVKLQLKFGVIGCNNNLLQERSRVKRDKRGTTESKIPTAYKVKL